MKSAQRFRRLAVMAALSIFAGLAGCDAFDDDDPNPVAPPDYSGDRVSIAGTCRASSTGTAQIVCQDSTSARPLEALVSIVFSLEDVDGLVVESRPADPSQSVPRQVVFAGLRTGTYNVTQRVLDRSGQTHVLTYRNLIVSSGFFQGPEIIGSPG